MSKSPSPNECRPGAATRRAPAGSTTLTGYANHLPLKDPKQMWSLVTYCRNHIETVQGTWSAEHKQRRKPLHFQPPMLTTAPTAAPNVSTHSGGHYGSWVHTTKTCMGQFSSSQSALSSGTTYVQNNLSYSKLEAKTHSVKIVDQKHYVPCQTTLLKHLGLFWETGMDWEDMDGLILFISVCPFQRYHTCPDKPLLREAGNPNTHQESHLTDQAHLSNPGTPHLSTPPWTDQVICSPKMLVPLHVPRARYRQFTCSQRPIGHAKMYEIRAHLH
ncbi:hypothetical protein GOODEAATRI_032122 [Goodea atripinnis]|uniref:Uncharacterized protein n=1 Tax=Goodea atripinnis TaxID=208336 RepID=A0ABV0P9H7_9TELE